MYVIVGKLVKDYWPLSLSPKTLEGARRSVDWQVSGGRWREDYAICKRIGPLQFKDAKSGEEYAVRNGVFTEAAWKKFLGVQLHNAHVQLYEAAGLEHFTKVAVASMAVIKHKQHAMHVLPYLRSIKP